MRNNDKTFFETICEVSAHVPVLLSRLLNHPCSRDCFPITRPLQGRRITPQKLVVYSISVPDPRFISFVSDTKIKQNHNTKTFLYPHSRNSISTSPVQAYSHVIHHTIDPLISPIDGRAAPWRINSQVTWPPLDDIRGGH